MVYSQFLFPVVSLFSIVSPVRSPVSPSFFRLVDFSVVVQAPDRQDLALYVALGSAIAFTFGWHVHEKATMRHRKAIAELDFCRWYHEDVTIWR